MGFLCQGPPEVHTRLIHSQPLWEVKWVIVCFLEETLLGTFSQHSFAHTTGKHLLSTTCHQQARNTENLNVAKANVHSLPDLYSFFSSCS